MADPEVQIAVGDDDVEMQGDDGNAIDEIPETGVPAEEEATATAQEIEDKNAPKLTFADYLQSPIIELVVGSGDHQFILTAHQALLVRSPFFESALNEPSSQRRISLVDDELDSVSCFLEYLYTGEYRPRKLPSGTLEPDNSSPAIDDTGDQLLKHAKVYTLAEKLGVPALKALSHSKIHLVTSTALAEIAYARYVYSHTSRSDLTIRKPVASFWGQRSHVLRHETEGSFRAMCLQYPEFAFDVLSFVLDVEEKREKRRETEDGRSARKRKTGER